MPGASHQTLGTQPNYPMTFPQYANAAGRVIRCEIGIAAITDIGTAILRYSQTFRAQQAANNALFIFGVVLSHHF